MDISLQQEEIIMKRLFCFFLIFMLVPAALAAVPSQVSVYRDGVLSRQEDLHFDDQGRLVQVDTYFPDMDAHITLTCTYDSEGRLLSATEDGSWLEYGNHEYEYTPQGMLRQHLLYWGCGNLPCEQTEYVYDHHGRLQAEILLLPDVEADEMYVFSIYTYDYLLDDRNRVLESHCYTRYTDLPMVEIVSGYGEYPATETVYVHRYTYDEQDRVVSDQSCMMPASALNPEGNLQAVEKRDAVQYYYDFAPFLVSNRYNSIAVVSITDSQGTEVWYMAIPVHFYADGDRLLRSENPVTGETVEFTYAD